jgi:hypothetical protein
METGAEESSTALVLTFLGTSEEAENLVDNTYEFMTPVAEITGMTNAFDDTTNTQVITLEGTGFGTDISTIEFYIDNVAQ